MKIQVDPRTGKIIEGKRREKSVPIQIKKNNLPEESWLEMAKQIGKTIAEEILKSGGIPFSSSQGSQESSDNHPITIDESIIDVGIGKTEELKKGEESATLTKIATEEDQDISKAKNLLRKLKG